MHCGHSTHENKYSAFFHPVPELFEMLRFGRFGVHRMLITPAGCAGRLGSLVTEAELGDHPVIETEEACPVQALKEGDFDRRRCWDRLRQLRRIQLVQLLFGGQVVQGACLLPLRTAGA